MLAVKYGKDNLHTTLSDHELSPNGSIDPYHNADQLHILDTLASSVSQGIEEAGARAVQTRGVDLGRLVTNRKTVVALGQPTEGLWIMNEQVKVASANLGITNPKGKGLKGAWGAHITVNRILEDTTPEVAHPVAELLDGISPIRAGRT